MNDSCGTVHYIDTKVEALKANIWNVKTKWQMVVVTTLYKLLVCYYKPSYKFILVP